MEVKVEVVLKEMIKPSSQTPLELRKLKLSFLDQIAPDCYTPIIYFYPSAQLQTSIVDRSQIGSSLKSSLSLILTHFYPLAGTIVGGCSVDCDDEGVEYCEAQVSCTLSEMVAEPEQNLLLRLLPLQPNSHDEPGSKLRKPNLGVQYNIFKCGGIAIAVSVSHKLCDGTSATFFVKQWAATSRGAKDVIGPSFDSAELFPPADLSGVGRPKFDGVNVVSKSFVFTKDNIATLREKVTAVSDGDRFAKPPTRVEAISAFIWKHFMTVVRSKKPKTKAFPAIQSVNLRRRIDPPLPESSMGNIYWHAFSASPMSEEENYQFLIEQMRKSIKGMDNAAVKRLQDVENTMELKKKAAMAIKAGEIEFCSFTSWCRFPLYEVDFGWGKPSWVCSPIGMHKNVVVLMPAAGGGGDGVEAWITFEEEVMAAFERDPEVLAFTSSRSERY